MSAAETEPKRRCWASTHSTRSGDVMSACFECAVSVLYEWCMNEALLDCGVSPFITNVYTWIELHLELHLRCDHIIQRCYRLCTSNAQLCASAALLWCSTDAGLTALRQSLAESTSHNGYYWHRSVGATAERNVNELILHLSHIIQPLNWQSTGSHFENLIL